MNNYHTITVNPLVCWLYRAFIAKMFCFITSLNSTLAKSCYREATATIRLFADFVGLLVHLAQCFLVVQFDEH